MIRERLARLPRLRVDALLRAALGRRRPLVWGHGTTAGLARKSYYRARAGFPAPLIITRHHGNAPASVADEILGLSRMDWNPFDVYTKDPATIQSSNAIARIGVLLERSGVLSYDHRLFI